VAKVSIVNLPKHTKSTQKRHSPLPITRQIFQKDSRIQHQIPSPAKRTQTHKQAQHLPIRRRTRDNGKHRAHDQTNIERDSPPHNIRRHTPKQRANQHAHIRRDRQPIGIPRAKLESRRRRDNGLNEQNERIDGIPEAIENKEFPMIRRESNFIFAQSLVRSQAHSCTEHTNSVINKMHLRI
jgi:hypothetical protein